MKGKIVLFCILSGLIFAGLNSQAQEETQENSDMQIILGDGLDSDFMHVNSPERQKKHRRTRQSNKRQKGNKYVRRNLKKRMTKVCSEAALNSEQEKDIQKGITDLQKSRNTLKAEVKNARIDFRQALRSNTSTAQEIDAAIEAVGTAVGNLAVTGPNFKANLVNDILAPDQKKLGLRCVNLKMKMMHKHKRRAKGKRGHKRHNSKN